MKIKIEFEEGLTKRARKVTIRARFYITSFLCAMDTFGRFTYTDACYAIFSGIGTVPVSDGFNSLYRKRADYSNDFRNSGNNFLLFKSFFVAWICYGSPVL